MSEQLTPYEQERVQALRRYMSAMERGDAETIGAVLGEAEQDQALERMLLEVNAVYEHDDHMVVQAGDVAAARLLLKTVATEQIIRREEMHAEDNRAATTTRDCRYAGAGPDEQGKSLNVNSQYPARKLVGRKVATPVFPARMVTSGKMYRSRRPWIAAAVAAALIAIVLLPGTSALAGQFLSFFRIQQFKVVQVSQQDAATLSNYSAPGIDDFGSVQFQDNSFQMQHNLTQAQAAQRVNFAILLPSKLPQGITGNAAFSVVGSGHGTLTFSAAKMHAYLVKNGLGSVQVPAKLDGATFEVTTTAGVVVSYGSHAGNPFMLVEMPSPVIQATGKASLQELRDFVLALPGLPPQLVAQLKQVDLNSGTFPIPVPAGVDAKSITVQGTSGLLLSSSKATKVENVEQFPAGSLVVWQVHGVIYAVGGIVADASQLLAAANSLH